MKQTELEGISERDFQTAGNGFRDGPAASSNSNASTPVDLTSERGAPVPPQKPEKLPLPRGHRRSYCAFCDCERVFRRRPLDHGTHSILTIVTLGLWGVVWAGAILRHSKRETWRCGWCGHRQRLRIHRGAKQVR